jgi:SAM-dependent methyltransferase
MESLSMGDAAKNGRFSGSYLVRKGFDPLEARIIVYEAGEPPREITHKEMADRINIIQKPKAIDDQFIETTRMPEYMRLVEIGSRNRSGTIRNDIFDGRDYTGVDVLRGENVNLLADAHQLSRHFDPGSVDAVFSLNTFEHLAMPLQVILEINKILRVGGLVYLDAPQTIGLHEMPWDFFRFSDRAWESLLNKATGFEVIRTRMNHPTHIVPMFYQGGIFSNYKATAGYLGSAVLARKTGDPTVTLDADFSQTATGLYPE